MNDWKDNYTDPRDIEKIERMVEKRERDEDEMREALRRFDERQEAAWAEVDDLATKEP